MTLEFQLGFSVRTHGEFPAARNWGSASRSSALGSSTSGSYSSALDYEASQLESESSETNSSLPAPSEEDAGLLEPVRP